MRVKVSDLAHFKVGLCVKSAEAFLSILTSKPLRMVFSDHNLSSRRS